MESICKWFIYQLALSCSSLLLSLGWQYQGRVLLRSRICKRINLCLIFQLIWDHLYHHINKLCCWKYTLDLYYRSQHGPVRPITGSCLRQHVQTGCGLWCSFPTSPARAWPSLFAVCWHSFPLPRSSVDFCLVAWPGFTFLEFQLDHIVLIKSVRMCWVL